MNNCKPSEEQHRIAVGGRWSAVGVAHRVVARRRHFHWIPGDLGPLHTVTRSNDPSSITS